LLGVLSKGQFFARVVMMWLYNNTKHSALLVGLFHSSFNVTTGALGREFIPGWSNGSVLLIASGVVAVAAALIVVFARGRLGYQPERGSHIAAAPLPGGERQKEAARI
jgi:hypothetical protein